jgi:hypothetical protein
MTYDEWFEHYQPIKNELVNYDQHAFETYGAEQDFVLAQPNENVWTEVDGDGGCYIVAGFAFVNRIQYYITTKPFDHEDQEVVVNLYKECDECGTYGGGGTDEDGNDCPTCGNNYDEYTIYPNRQDLIDIYGEEYANANV